MPAILLRTLHRCNPSNVSFLLIRHQMGHYHRNIVCTLQIHRLCSQRSHAGRMLKSTRSPHSVCHHHRHSIVGILQIRRSYNPHIPAVHTWQSTHNLPLQLGCSRLATQLQ
jgi:hypothetical protein